MVRDVRTLLVSAGLLAATFLAYLPAVNADFIWNDSDYVTAPALRSTAGLGRIWFEVGATEQYYPFLHSAFWVQHRLWGDHPAGYHVVNILLHAGSAILLLLILRRLAIPGAALAAFVFALHPVYVESVAWISEQKNTLSLFCYLLAALAYLRFDATRRAPVYWVATALFVIALLSKSVTATLPPTLLVVFWWQRGRLAWRRDVLPLVPWFALGAAMGLVSAWVERKFIGAEGAEFALTFAQRGLLAGRVVWFYLGKLLWPADLIFIYPRWTVDPAQAWQWVFPLGVLVALAGLWWGRGRTRAPLAAALFFGGSLFPVLGFFNVYAFLFSFVADHWQYLPSIGVVVLVAAAISRGLRRAGIVVRTGMPATLVLALGLLSFHQSRMYADMRTFYRTTLARNPDCWMAHNNLGNLLREDRQYDAAVTHFEAALRVRPDLPKAHYNLANTLRDLKRRDEALPHYRRALELQPNYTDALNAIGNLLRELGRPAEALPPLLQALQLEPEYADAQNNLGMALRDLGRLPEALVQFERAARADPRASPAQLYLAFTLSLLGRDTEAMEHFREARRLNPALPDLKM
jgi:tetratricopeptide (TPR) repeat protein